MTRADREHCGVWTRTETEEQEPEFIAIADIDQWDAFVEFNREALSDVAPLGTCLRLAMNQELLIGGGAAPLFRVGFVDKEE